MGIPKTSVQIAQIFERIWEKRAGNRRKYKKKQIQKGRGETFVSPRWKSWLTAASIPAATPVVTKKSVSTAAAAAQNQDQPQPAAVIATAIATAIAAQKTIAVATAGGQKKQPNQSIAAAVVPIVTTTPAVRSS